MSFRHSQSKCLRRAPPKRERRAPQRDSSSSDGDADHHAPDGTQDLQLKLVQAVRDRRANSVRALLQDAERLRIDISSIRDCPEKGNTLLHLVLAKKCAKGR